jgi:tetratricopeptide (TPR) repeat protein
MSITIEEKNKKMLRVFGLIFITLVILLVAILLPSSVEDDSDVLLAILMTKSYSVPGNIPWKNFMVCDVRDRNQCLKNARFQNPKHVLMVDLDNYKFDKHKPIKSLLHESIMYYVPITSGIHTWNAPVLLPQLALEVCKYNGKILECPPETLTGFTDAYTIQDYSKPEAELDLFDKTKHFVHLGRAYENVNKTDVALSWYEKELTKNITKCTPEYYYALYRKAVIKLLHQNNGTHEDFWKAYMCNPFRKETLYYLARMARSNEQFSGCLLYTHAALILQQPDMNELYIETNIYNWAIEDQHAECLFYSGRKDQARWYWEKILERNELPNEQTRKRIEGNARLV